MIKHKAIIRVVHDYHTRKDKKRIYHSKHIIRNVWSIEQTSSGEPPKYEWPTPRWALERIWKQFRGRARIDCQELNVFFWTFDDLPPVYGGASSEKSFMFPEDLSAHGWFNLADHPGIEHFVNPRMTIAGQWVAKRLDTPTFFSRVMSDRCPLCYHLTEHQVCDMCFGRGLDHGCPDCQDEKPEWHECIGCGWRDDEK